jgi:hypothetical protein
MVVVSAMVFLQPANRANAIYAKGVTCPDLLDQESPARGLPGVVKRNGDQRLAVLGARNDVHEEVRVGVLAAARQKPAPLEEPQGRSAGPAPPSLGGILLDSSTR